jgi:membrane protein
MAKMPGLYALASGGPGSPSTMQLDSARDFLRLLAERFAATRCPQVAGSLAFTTLLAIVPLVTVILALFSNFPAFARLGMSLRSFLLENLLPDRAGQIIATYAFQFSQKAAGLTLIGMALLVLTALMLLLTIDRVFNNIWGVRRPRPLLRRIMVHWFALTLGPLALGGALLATGHLVATSIALAGEGSWVGEFTARLVPPVLLSSLFSFLYYAVPNHPVRMLHALAGGVATAIVFLLMQRLFGLFIAQIPSYTLIYGTFAALPIFLVWLYLSWVVILLGAALSATLPGFFERSRILPGFPGYRAWAATNMLIVLAQAQRDGRTLPFGPLQECARVGSNEGELLLGDMCDAGWVVRTEDGNWVLSRDANDIGLATIIDRYALSPSNWLAAPGAEASRHVGQRLADAMRSADAPLSSMVARPATADPQIG